MPIRINLLAEQQAAEEMRRRDPVKRAIWGAVFLVALILLWSGWLQIQIMRTTSRVDQLNQQWKQIEADHERITADLKDTMAVEQKLNALYNMCTNRHLWAPVLNAFQYTMVEDVQVVRLSGSEAYRLTEPVKKGGKVTRPATSTERITLGIEARVYGDSPVQQVNEFKNAIASHPFFKSVLTNQNSIRIGPISPRSAAGLQGRSYRSFTIECNWPEITRGNE